MDDIPLPNTSPQNESGFVKPIKRARSSTRDSEDFERDDNDPSHNYSPDSQIHRSACKKRKPNNRKTVPTSTRAEISAGTIRKQKSDRLYASCFEIVSPIPDWVL